MEDAMPSDYGRVLGGAARGVPRVLRVGTAVARVLAHRAQLSADVPHSAIHRRAAAAEPVRWLEGERDAVDPRGDHRVSQLRRQVTSITGREDPHDLVTLVHGLATNRVPVPHFNNNLLSLSSIAKVFYAIYITILFQLPNARYYQDIDVLTEAKLQSVILSILIYAALELLMIMHLYCALKRNVGISAFYQLAFTLENEWQIYHYNFQDWTLVVFQFMLVHTVQIGDYVSHVKPRGKTPATDVGSSTLRHVQSVENQCVDFMRVKQKAGVEFIERHRTCLLYIVYDKKTLAPYYLQMRRYSQLQLPITYALYVAILFHSPNVRYYQDRDGLTHEKLQAVITNILVNGAMELLSFMHVERKLKRQFGVSCLLSAWVIVVPVFAGS
ncbi:hypothetical protein FI667_g15464, partial [Globisporangium splendens]